MEDRNPEAYWRVKWFDLERYWNIECQAINEGLAVAMTRRTVSMAEGIQQRHLVLISAERIG